MSKVEGDEIEIVVPGVGTIQGRIVTVICRFELKPELIRKTRLSKYSHHRRKGEDHICMGNLTKQDYTNDLYKDAARLSKSIVKANKLDTLGDRKIFVFDDSRFTVLFYRDLRLLTYEAGLLIYLLTKLPPYHTKIEVIALTGRVSLGADLDFVQIREDFEGMDEYDKCLDSESCLYTIPVGKTNYAIKAAGDGTIQSEGCGDYKVMLEHLIEGCLLMAPYMISPTPKPALR